MTSKILEPAVRPCASCPYRVDAPSGSLVSQRIRQSWSTTTRDTPYHPIEVFVCHQAPDRLCAGWCGTHHMGENLAVRIAVPRGPFRPPGVGARPSKNYPQPRVPSYTPSGAPTRGAKTTGPAGEIFQPTPGGPPTKN